MPAFNRFGVALLLAGHAAISSASGTALMFGTTTKTTGEPLATVCGGVALFLGALAKTQTRNFSPPTTLDAHCDPAASSELLDFPEATAPTAPEEPDDAHGLRLIIDRCVERAGPRWTPAAKSAAAEQYLVLFQRGDDSALTGAMADVWGEHALFTKQYQSHLNAAGHRWHEMTPANYQRTKARSSTTSHGIAAAGKSFVLPGMAEVQAKQGWTDAQLAKAVAAYGQFVRAVLANKQLPKAERGGLAPSHAVDEVWHQHMRFQAAYRKMSAALLGGRRRFLHHAPHISDADSASGPSSYAHTLKLIGDAGETPDAWAWPRASEGDACGECGQGVCGDDTLVYACRGDAGAGLKGDTVAAEDCSSCGSIECRAHDSCNAGVYPDDD